MSTPSRLEVRGDDIRPSRRRPLAPFAGRDGAEAEPQTPSQSKLGVTARSFSILDHVASARGPVDVLEIIASLNLPKATAYRLVDWFITQGYLLREPSRKRLIVGPKLTNLAFGALMSAMRNATPHIVLQRLVRTVNETCNIGMMLNGEIVYLDRVEADHWPLRLQYSSGSRVPLHSTAIGKLFLAMTSPARLDRLLQTLELRRFTDQTITNRTKFNAEIEQIRKERVSFDREETLVGVVCAAVPVAGRNGEMIAGLAVQAPEARMNIQTARKHLPALREAARELAEIFHDNDCVPPFVRRRPREANE
jgi:IclR family transcriptional regulator, acetate operon repressor